MKVTPRGMTDVGPFRDLSLLPESERERLCVEILTEAGVQITNITSKGEIQHRCAMPWHEDRSPSASLNYKKLVYGCYSCGSSGGLLWLVSTLRSTDASGAIAWIKGFAGLTNDPQDSEDILRFLEDLYSSRPSGAAPIPKMSTAVLSPWLNIHPYLTENRRVPVDNIIASSVGWDPVTDRIVIPHFWKGDLVGWQMRRLDPSSNFPKYQSSVEFPKDTTIFQHEPGRDCAVVVESPMSVLRHRHHLPIEATFGASVTDRQVELLGSHLKVILFMDNDNAGWIATEQMIEGLTPYTNVWVAMSPWAADPGDMDDATVEQLVAAAVPSSLWHRPMHLDPWE